MTLVVMLDGPSSVFLQVAEYKEPSKFGSFTALSVSLGHILVQLHTGLTKCFTSVLSSVFYFVHVISSFIL